MLRVLSMATGQNRGQNQTGLLAEALVAAEAPLGAVGIAAPPQHQHRSRKQQVSTPYGLGNAVIFSNRNSCLLASACLQQCM